MHSFKSLGQIMLDAVGAEVCRAAYETDDAEWVGRYALDYGDINRDGSLN